MDHLRSSVLVLASSGISDRQHFARGLGAHEVDARVLHREPGPDVSVDPLDVCLGLGPRPLGDQVVDVVRPVLDGRVRDPRSFERNELDHRGVQGVGRVHRSGASFDVVHLGTDVSDDQRALELAHVLGIDPEVGLQGLIDDDIGGHVDERAARPHRRVEGGELVVVGRNDRPEVLTDQIWMLTDRGIHVAEDDTELLKVLAVAVEHDLGLVLGGDAGEVLPLRLRNPQLLVGVLDGIGEVLPLVHLPAGRLDVVVDVVEVEVGHIDGEPLGHRALLKALQGPETEVPHPFGLLLHGRHLAHDRLVQPLLGLEDVVLFVGPSKLVLPEIEIGGRHGTPDRLAGWIISPIQIVTTPPVRPHGLTPALQSRPPSRCRLPLRRL